MKPLNNQKTIDYSSKTTQGKSSADEYMRVLKQSGSTVMDLTKIRSLRNILAEGKKKSEKAIKKAR